MAGSGAISRCVGVMLMLWLVAHEGRAISLASPCHVLLRNGNGPGKFLFGNFFWKHVSKSSCMVSRLRSWFSCAFEGGPVHGALV